MPRKSRFAPSPSGWAAASFNEAGAVMPRKSQHHRFHRPRRPRASMRPGLLCPGRAIGIKTNGQSESASMRPGLLCPGRDLDLIGGVVHGRASMRPGLLCPGRVRRQAAPSGEARQASMRPGLLCPGRGRRGGSAAPGWRGFNEAGAVMPRKSFGGRSKKTTTVQLQ